MSGYRQANMVPGPGFEPGWITPGDFKSPVSANFTIPAKRKGGGEVTQPLLWFGESMLPRN